jgi:hypothetical protein
MAGASASGASQPKILEQLVEAGKGAFDPSVTDQAAKNASLRRYEELIQRYERVCSRLDVLRKSDKSRAARKQRFCYLL